MTDQSPKTINDFWQEKNSQKERITETIKEVWLVENGAKIKLIEKATNTYKELISEGNK